MLVFVRKYCFSYKAHIRMCGRFFHLIFLCSGFANAAINRLRVDEHHQINKLGF